MKKRFLSILMAAAMVLSLLPASALAAEGATVTVATGDDLVSAITGAEDGATITLSGDVTVSTPIVINKSLTLDLNGHTLIYSGSGKNAIAVQENDGITFAMRNGTLKVTDTTSNAQHAGVVVDWASGVTVDLDGVNIEMSGADNFASYYGVAVNGSSENGSLHVDLNGCTITGAGIGVYFPPVSDSLTIENSTISAWTAVVVKGGNVTISNSNLTGTEQEYDSSYYQSANYNNSGANTAGEALYLEGNYDRNVNIVLNGGTYTSEGNYAIRAQFLNSKYDHNIEIKNGIFTGKQGVIYEGHSSNTVCNTSYPNDAENAKAAISITGGTFSSDVSEYVTEGYTTATIDDQTIVVTDGASPVATVGDYGFSTLAGAVAAARAGDTVTLQADCTVTGPIAVEKDLTLDLNGHMITNGIAGSYLFRTSADLTVDGTDSGSGMTIPTSNTDARGFIQVIQTAVLTLKGGSYTGVPESRDNALFYLSADETESYAYDSGANGSTAILEDLTVETGCRTFQMDTLDLITLKVTGGSYASTAGSTSDDEKYNVFGVDCIQIPEEANLTFEDVTVTSAGGACIEVCGGRATFTDCDFTVENPSVPGFTATAVAASWEGNATIVSGTYQSQGYGAYVYSSGGTINVQGGTVTGSEAAVRADVNDTYGNPATVNISGGQIRGALTTNGNEKATISITGGYFTSDPSEYCADGRTGLPGSYVVDGVTYGYMVDDELPADVKVVEGAAKVTVPSASELGITEEQRIALDTAVAEISSDGLTEQGNTVAADDTTNLPTADNALTAFNEKKPSEATEATNVTVVVVPRLEVAVEAYNPTNQTMTLEIEAVYDIKATTNLNDMKEQGDVGVNNEDVNTVTLTKRAGTLDTTGTEVVISIPLPSGFVSSGDSVYIQHKGYEYTANVASSGSGDGTTYTATFTNPHGFSEFTISTTSQAVAMVGGESYADFQAAVDAAPNGGTITIPLTAILPTEGLSATISGSSNKSVTVKNETSNEVTVNINGNSQTLAGNGGTYSFTYTAPNGGSGTTRYTVTVSDSIVNGDITVSPGRASYNQTVTVTVSPDEGYELAALVVTDRNGSALTITPQGDNRYTFKMPRSAVTVEASFQLLAPWSSPYADVNTGDWFYDAVEYVVESGLMTGTSATTFEPDATLTRAMMATVLWAMEGGPVVNYAMAYTDVDSDDWFAEAVRWATSEGVVNGVGDNAYAPNDPLTREQMAVMLYAYAVYKGYDTTQGGMAIREFGDYEEVSDWAATAMDWAVNAGLLGGKPGNLLDPTGSATRAEIATILRNFCENIVK